MNLIAVAAVAANGVIGAGGDLVWRNSEDFARLKALTMGHTLIMGRKNFESIGRALPGRRTVVLTRNPDWAAPGTVVVHDAGASLDAALARIVAETGDDTFFVFGGGEIYRLLMDRTDTLELTEIAARLDGDITFPVIDPSDWTATTRQERDGFAWVRYERRSSRTASAAAQS